MTIAQRGSATTGTSANVVDGGTLACNKPVGVVDGDVLLAWVTRNDRTLDMPSGWTQVDDKVAGVAGTDHFETALCSHVAASDGASYTWTVHGATAAPMLITIVAFSGVDTVHPLAGETMVGYNTDQVEPLTTGTTAKLYGVQYRALYSRSARIVSATPITFTTAGAATEISDAGIFSGGTVSYSQAVYLANAVATAATGAALTISGTAITDTHDVTTIALLTDQAVLPNPQYVNNPDTYGTAQSNRRASRW